MNKYGEAVSALLVWLMRAMPAVEKCEECKANRKSEPSGERGRDRATTQAS